MLLKKNSPYTAQVKILQMLLNRALDFSLSADGDFGAMTEQAVIIFQKEHIDNEGHFLVPDGIVGEKTWNALNHACSTDYPFDPTDSKGNLSPLSPKDYFKCPILHSRRLITEIIIHCTATPEGKPFTVEDIDRSHRAQGWKCIGYHYVVYPDGTIHKGRDINEIGSHCKGHNSNSIGIVYVGGLAKDGKTPKDTRTPQQIVALEMLTATLLKEYSLTTKSVHGHYEYANKACPSFKIEPFRKTLSDKLLDFNFLLTLPKVLIPILFVFMSFFSCSKKTVSTVIDDNTEENIESVSSQITFDTSHSTLNFESFTNIMQGSEQWWQAHIVRTTYTLDSLNNQTVTHKEEIDLEGGRKDSTLTDNNLTLNKDDSSTHQVAIHDTLYINRKQVIRVKEKVKVTPPWFKTLSFILIPIIILTIIFILYKSIRYFARRHLENSFQDQSE